ncbi:hypothetical protein Ae201684P_013096 [Aphanomyces euteiches]|nr:hypothetical protein Ae201684P_013096 [Aphanomyces euteiches]
MPTKKNSSVKASMDFTGPLNAVSISQSQKFIAVGGRDVLKIVGLESTGFVERRNLRSSKSNLNFSTNDIRWHPQSDSMLATAATNGYLILWDIQRDSSKMNKREVKAHDRAVNRICWHPTDPNLLLSASQDGLIKLWDQRLKGKNVNIFQQQKSESVRDVKFSLFDDSKFAAAFENGTVEIWELRNNRHPEIKFPAHQGHILSLDWHPSRPGFIATGSRDRSVKIWDLSMNPNYIKPVQTIALIANAGRIQWRPNCPEQIATSSSITDSRINLWDTQRPFVPLACMHGHADIVSDFQWIDTPRVQLSTNPSDSTSDVEGCDYWQHVIACSKDKTLTLHSLADSVKPHQSMHTVALTMNTEGQIVSSHDAIDRSCSSLNIHQHEHASNPLFSVASTTVAMQRNARKVKSAANLVQMPRMSSFKAPTRKNTSSGSLPSVQASFASNEPVHHNTTLDSPIPPPQGMVSVASFKNSVSYQEFRDVLDGKSVLSLLANDRITPQIFGFDEQVFRFLARSYVLYDESFQQMCTQNAKVASVAGCSHLSKTWMILQLLYEKRTTAYHKDATLMDSENTDTQWFNQHPSSTQTSKLLAQLDEVNPMHGVDAYPYDEVKDTSTEALQAQQASAQSVDISRVQDTLLKELLDYYCEAGDVQSCATIAAAMNTVTNIELIMGKGWLQQVYMHYIDLLHQLQLYSIANYLVKNCPDLGIRQMNMKATTIYTSCSKCGKTIDPLPPKVAKVCQKSLCTQCFNITYCSICQLPASGLFVWCPVCSHGGHLQHMQDWFATQQVCPTGCSHVCAPFILGR